MLCTKDCETRYQGYVHPTIPLLACHSHSTDETTPLILSPLATNYRGNQITLPLLSSAKATRWFLNGQPINAPTLTLTPGHYTLLAITDQRAETISFSILSNAFA